MSFYYPTQSWLVQTEPSAPVCARRCGPSYISQEGVDWQRMVYAAQRVAREREAYRQQLLYEEQRDLVEMVRQMAVQEAAVQRREQRRREMAEARRRALLERRRVAEARRDQIEMVRAFQLQHAMEQAAERKAAEAQLMSRLVLHLAERDEADDQYSDACSGECAGPCASCDCAGLQSLAGPAEPAPAAVQAPSATESPAAVESPRATATPAETKHELLFSRDFPDASTAFGKQVRKAVRSDTIHLEPFTDGHLRITGLWPTAAPTSRPASPHKVHVRDVDEDGNEILLPEDSGSESESEAVSFDQSATIDLPAADKLEGLRAELTDDGFRLWLDTVA